MKRELLRRLGFGALCGLAGMAPLTVLIPYGEYSALTALCGGHAGLAGMVRLLAGAAWGAAVCAGALLWQRERGTFFTSSVWNYLLDCGAFVLWIWVCVGFDAAYIPAAWAVFTGLYFIGWVVRWLTCRRDVEAIRERLGLKPPVCAPSPLRWRESLPYLLLTAALFLGLFPALAPFDDPSFPALTCIVVPYLTFPFIAAVVGFGAGVRHGFCPLTVLVTAAAFLPNLLYQPQAYFWFQGVICTVLSLAGNLLGCARRRWIRERRSAAGPEERPQ